MSNEAIRTQAPETVTYFDVRIHERRAAAEAAVADAERQNVESTRRYLAKYGTKEEQTQAERNFVLAAIAGDAREAAERDPVAYWE